MKDYIHFFLNDIPNFNCSQGGGPSYLHSVKFFDDAKNESLPIKASHFMTYHIPLKHSADFTKALRNARIIAENIEESLNKDPKVGANSKVRVFPYSFFYVFYEQYAHIAKDAVKNLFPAFGTIIGVTLIFLEWNLPASLVVAGTVGSIVVNLSGVMYLFDISFNAISLVNLVMVSNRYYFISFALI